MLHFQNIFLISIITVVIILLVPLKTGIILTKYLMPIILFCAIAIILLGFTKKKV